MDKKGLYMCCGQNVYSSNPKQKTVRWFQVGNDFNKPKEVKKVKEKREEFKLITIYGDEIIIEADENCFEEIHDEILEKLDGNKLYFVGDYSETAKYKGYELTIIDLKKVIGRE